MARQLLALAGGILLATAVVSPQSRSQTPPPSSVQQSETREFTMTGCIVAGNSAGAFILDNALERIGTPEKQRAFRLIGAAEDMDFMQHLNHRVQIVGTADRRLPEPPAPRAKIAERDLPLLSVKTIQDLGDTCAG